MFLTFCPHCHTPLSPPELEEAATSKCRYLVCPECDELFPVLADQLTRENTATPEGERDV